MSRGAWNVIKRSKRFYVDTFRFAGSALIFSTGLSIVLCLAIYYAYFTQPEHDFYATDGVTPPVLLVPMNAANGSKDPLLGDDQTTDNAMRTIPK